MRISELTLISTLVILSIISLWFAFGFPPPFDSSEPGPGIFPKLVSLCLLSTCIIYIILRHKGSQPPPKYKYDNLMKPSVCLALTIVYLLAMPKIGYIISTAVFIPAMMLLFNVKNKNVILLVTIVFTIAAYLVFAKFLNVELPGFSI